MTFFKLLGLTTILNILRYFPGGWIESITIMEPMHAPMETQAACFGFTEADFPTSLLYNFIMWFAVVLIFHVGHHSLKGKMIVRSLTLFGVCCLFFVSLAAIYMNHYNQEIRTFYLYSMLDALILFPFLGILNGLLYPLFFKGSKHSDNPEAGA